MFVFFVHTKYFGWTIFLIDNLGHLVYNVHKQAKNLGVIFDSEVKFDKYVNSVVNACLFHVRCIAKIKSFLLFNDVKQVIQAFKLSRLYLYLGGPLVLLNHRQLPQNAITRLLTGTMKQVRVSPALTSLHWLPVNFKV